MHFFTYKYCTYMWGTTLTLFSFKCSICMIHALHSYFQRVKLENDVQGLKEKCEEEQNLVRTTMIYYKITNFVEH